MAKTYPLWPSETAKKKYYDLVQNLPLFLPEHGDHFGDFIDKYPVAPYLDSRESFCRWVHFIHNRVNEELGKPPLSFVDAEAAYQAHCTPDQEKRKSDDARKRTVAAWIVMSGLLVLAAGLGARGEILEL